MFIFIFVEYYLFEYASIFGISIRISNWLLHSFQACKSRICGFFCIYLAQIL